MTPAVASLIALLIAIALSLTSRVNVGVVAIVFAWLIGTLMAGLKPDQVAAGFPSPLFLTLVGVTFLFALAEANGTLERMTNRAVRLARGNARVVPLIFFAVACLISTIGPGAIISVALVAPLAMAIGPRMGVSPFLTALMVANGANAGNLSPISATGVIANTKMVEAGIGAHEMKVWVANLVAHVLVAGVAYLFLVRRLPAGSSSGLEEAATPAVVLEQPHRITLVVIVLWIVGVVGFKLNVGLAAFAAAALLVLVQVSDEGVAIKRVPWGVIIMVCGVTVLIALLEKTGGMDLFTSMLARLATPRSINGVVAFTAGLISSWSSTAGVVLPVFLPAVPGLVAKVGGGDPLAVALSINVGGSMVDVSPLSTLGALCVAAVADPGQAKTLFRQLLIWGLSMSVVGAVLCAAIAGIFARS
jgi:Na+/H+ antiporter NhaD/arsenite permease-like protein